MGIQEQVVNESRTSSNEMKLTILLVAAACLGAYAQKHPHAPEERTFPPPHAPEERGDFRHPHAPKERDFKHPHAPKERGYVFPKVRDFKHPHTHNARTCARTHTH